MSIGTVVFYRMNGSLSSGEYPLFSSGQDLSSHEIRRYYNVKYRDGLQITLDVPTFTGYRDVNLCTVDDRWYWVTEYREKTAAEGQITYTLDYAAPTDLLRYQDRFNCDAKRTPYATPALNWLRDEVSNGQMIVENTYPFADMECPGVSNSGNPAYWIQVSGHDNKGVPHTYGGFIAYDTTTEQFDMIGGIRPYVSLSTDTYVKYDNWIYNMTDITGFTDADIDDVSISKRCPFATASARIPGLTYATAVWLIDHEGNTIHPEKWDNRLYYYKIDELWDLVDETKQPVANAQQLTIPRSDNVHKFGTVGLYDWNRNEIMSLDGDRRINPRVTARMHADISGIYCVVEYNNSIISIPEGKLPYFGNVYSNYKAYSMDADRMAMQFAIETANYNRETEMWSAIGNTVSGVANNAMIGGLGGNPVSMASGVLGGITSGIVSNYQSQRGYDLALKEAQFNMELSKKRATSQPSSGYNVPYGSIYAYLNEHYPLCVMTKIPNCDATTFSTWNQQHGYPSEGVRTIRAQTGYYQGMILADGSIDANGMYFDRLNEVFQQGFKFVSP